MTSSYFKPVVSQWATGFSSLYIVIPFCVFQLQLSRSLLWLLVKDDLEFNAYFLNVCVWLRPGRSSWISILFLCFYFTCLYFCISVKDVHNLKFNAHLLKYLCVILARCIGQAEFPRHKNKWIWGKKSIYICMFFSQGCVWLLPCYCGQGGEDREGAAADKRCSRLEPS